MEPEAASADNTAHPYRLATGRSAYKCTQHVTYATEEENTADERR